MRVRSTSCAPGAWGTLTLTCCVENDENVACVWPPRAAHVATSCNNVASVWPGLYNFPERLNFVSYHAVIKLPHLIIGYNHHQLIRTQFSTDCDQGPFSWTLQAESLSGLPAASIKEHFVLIMHELKMQILNSGVSHTWPVTAKQDVGIFKQLWQTHAGFEKRAPGVNQLKIVSKIVFDDCIR